MKIKHRTLLLAMASLLTTLVRAESEDRPQAAFGDHVEVNLINLEVVISRDGEPVHGLTVEDFIVLDDGQAVEITNFYAIEESRRRLPVDAGESTGDAAENPEIEPFDLVILVDDRFLTSRSRGLLLGLVSEQLDSLLAAGARILVARQDRGVIVEQPLTADRAALASTLDRLAKSPGSLALGRAAGRSLQIQIRNGPLPSVNTVDASGRADMVEHLAAVLWGQILGHIQEVRVEVSRSNRSLERFLGSMAGLPRRKAMLYLCDQLPVRPGEQLVEEWWTKYGQAFGLSNNVHSPEEVLQRVDAGIEFAQLAASASAARVALYSMGDLPSLAGGSGVELSSASRRGRGGFGPLAADAAGLGLLASTSGGRRSHSLGLGAELLGQLQHDLSSYYSLAYPSPHGGDDGNHHVEIKLRDADLRLHHLANYHDKNAQQQMRDRTLAALYFANTENRLEARVEIDSIEETEKDRFAVSITVLWPLANLVLLPRGGSHFGRLSILIMARDESGRISDPATFEVPIEIPNPQLLAAMANDASFTTRLVMRGGEQVLVVGIRDDVGGENSSLRLPLRVGKRRR